MNRELNLRHKILKTKEFKGTPGPWKLTHILNDGDMVGLSETIGTEGNNWIAEAKGTHVLKGSPKEVLANAQLIASAPELLEALQYLVNANPNDGSYDYPASLENANRAVNKALGL